jgi:hypothetical protein
MLKVRSVFGMKKVTTYCFGKCIGLSPSVLSVLTDNLFFRDVKTSLKEPDGVVGWTSRKSGSAGCLIIAMVGI